MKILWIGSNQGNYKAHIVKGTGGWVGALQDALLKHSDVELGIAFPHTTDDKPINSGRLTYYPMLMPYINNRIIRVLRNAIYPIRKNENLIASRVKEVIEHFQPDVVHVWGIEQLHVAALSVINKPCVVHIQGFALFCLQAYLPPTFSENDLKKANPWWERVILRHGEWAKYCDMQDRAERELRYASYVKNWVGRTHWDKIAAQMLSPSSNYYHCEEVMRSNFSGLQWQFHYKDCLCIQSNISCDWYKGVDVILNTANMLTNQRISFRWDVYGIDKNAPMVKYMEKKLRIRSDDVHVYFQGRVDAVTICNSLLESDVYVHPSYIENSSNAIAEAMMLGVPVIAQYVGGNPSMLRDEGGVLVAPNEPLTLAYHIMQMRDEDVAVRYSSTALALASTRQSSEHVVQTLLDIYQSVR